MPRPRKTKVSKPFYSGANWNFQLLQDAQNYCAEIAFEELGLDCYKNQIEIISVEQMLDAYSANGLPIMYPHWTFGKKFISHDQQYTKGLMGLAYEIVINSNPCISYLMEENSMTMQTLVIAHAAFGHNHFFKNNNLFQEWTSADTILDYLIFAQNYIRRCEERYGIEEVERTIDACHALEQQGINRYKRPRKLSMAEEQERQRNRQRELQNQINELWTTLPEQEKKEKKQRDKDFIYPKEENILYFLEKNSPILEPWQREICRIVRKLAQYFYPQMQTKVMNEGFASYTHYYIMNRLWDKGLIDDGAMLEFLDSHAAVLAQPGFSSGAGFNPYALGFAVFDDMRRVATEPTKEDEEWFPDFCNTDWKENFLYAAETYRDESFILQHLSPKVMRDWRLFSLYDHEDRQYIEISAIHNDSGYKKVRKSLSRMYNTSHIIPDIQVDRVNFRGDRTLHLKHVSYRGVGLNKNTAKVLKQLRYLWGYKVVLDSVDYETDKVVSTHTVD